MKIKNKIGLTYIILLFTISFIGGNVVAAENSPSANTKPASIIGHGTIETIDLKKHQITIKHDAIKAIDWPAMTMPFTAFENLDISQWKAGDKIKFQLDKDKTNQIIQIEKSDK